MGTRTQTVDALLGRIRALAAAEAQAPKGWPQRRIATQRWALMLYREYLDDNVKVRAESLAYLMLISLLPLIAGAFFVFTIFTQFGMVQEAISNFVGQFLDTFPGEQREIVQDYVLRFKDAYLASISGKSGRLGIFALFFLVWVGLQSFNNIDRTLNEIWSSERDRPFLEKLRNFVVVTVGAPVVLIASLSVPPVLRNLPGTRQLFELFPILLAVLNTLIPVVLIFATFTLLYRFVPVRRVLWKNALWGGLFSAVGLQLVNGLMNLYFRFGTNTAYGKAAIVPLVAFWIYLVWTIVIMGAEVSYLSQNKRYYALQGLRSPSFLEAESMLFTLQTLNDAFERGDGPLTYDMILGKTKLNPGALRSVLGWIESEQLATRVINESQPDESSYQLARSLAQVKIAELLKRFVVEGRPRIAAGALDDEFETSLTHWLAYFGDRTFSSNLR